MMSVQHISNVYNSSLPDLSDLAVCLLCKFNSLDLNFSQHCFLVNNLATALASIFREGIIETREIMGRRGKDFDKLQLSHQIHYTLLR